MSAWILGFRTNTELSYYMPLALLESGAAKVGSWPCHSWFYALKISIYKGYAFSYFFDIDMFQAKITYLLKLSGSFSVRNLLRLFLFVLRMCINVGTQRYKDEHARNCKSAISYVDCRGP